MQCLQRPWTVGFWVLAASRHRVGGQFDFGAALCRACCAMLAFALAGGGDSRGHNTVRSVFDDVHVQLEAVICPALKYYCISCKRIMLCGHASARQVH